MTPQPTTTQPRNGAVPGPRAGTRAARAPAVEAGARHRPPPARRGREFPMISASPGAAPWTGNDLGLALTGYY